MDNGNAISARFPAGVLLAEVVVLATFIGVAFAAIRNEFDSGSFMLGLFGFLFVSVVIFAFCNLRTAQKLNLGQFSVALATISSLFSPVMSIIITVILLIMTLRQNR